MRKQLQKYLGTTPNAANRAIGIMHGVEFTTSTNNLIKESKLLKLDHITRIQTLTIMFKVSRGQMSLNIQDLLKRWDVPYQLRNEGNLKLPKARKNLKMFSIFYTGVKEWNSLYLDIRNSICCKKLVDKWKLKFSKLC